MREHEDYRGDSVVSERVNYDLLKVVEEITENEGKTGVGEEMLRSGWATRPKGSACG